MKHPAFLLAVSTILIISTTNTSTAQGNNRVYIMKKNGKLTEVMNGTRSAVTGDVTLPNHATVHPDGSVDDIDGYKKQLNEGDYISFVDGHIRKLSATAATSTTPATTAGATGGTTTSTTTTTAKTATTKSAKSTTPKKSAGNR
jgi:hypothetical protein